MMFPRFLFAGSLNIVMVPIDVYFVAKVSVFAHILLQHPASDGIDYLCFVIKIISTRESVDLLLLSP